jgi:hypothetical protein
MIIGYIGTRGRGKTLSCVREAYEHYKNGYTIYSNISLDKRYFKTYEKISHKDIMGWVEGDVQFKKAFFILDEVHVYLDSRMGMSKKNVIFTYFILQTRKRNVRIGYTTQFFDQVDKRLRQPTEVIISCQNFKDGKDVFQSNEIMEKETGRRFIDNFKANQYFGYYNTDEIVNPFLK